MHLHENRYIGYLELKRLLAQGIKIKATTNGNQLLPGKGDLATYYIGIEELAKFVFIQGVRLFGAHREKSTLCDGVSGGPLVPLGA